MTCYIVSFQADSAATRQKVRELLKSYSRYCPINNTCWAIISDQKASEVRDHVATALDSADRLFVIRSGTEAAWRNAIGQKHTDWLKKNL